MSSPPKKLRLPKKRTAAKLRSWRAWVLRQRAHPLGSVEAPDERSAEAAAADQFGLTNEQRRHLVVRVEEDAE
jgi:hypothetical protein